MRSEFRHAALRQRLLEIAEVQIARDGLDSLRARDLAAAAGCSVGTLYAVFRDLEDLGGQVRERALRRLGLELSANLPPDSAPPQGQLVALGCAYWRHAKAEPHLWRALFLPSGAYRSTLSETHHTELAALLRLVETPLETLRPDLPGPERAVLARALFSAVHGIVVLALDGVSVAVPPECVEEMIATLLPALARG